MIVNAQFWSFVSTGIYYILFEVLEEAIGKSEQVKIVGAGLWRLSRNAKAKGNYENNLLNYDINTKKVLLIDHKTRGLKNL